jgi:hypothetical protein
LKINSKEGHPHITIFEGTKTVEKKLFDQSAKSRLGGKVRTTKITTSKTKKNIEKIQNHQNIESVHLFSIKVIRMSKIENINYLWRITYGYQSLWRVRLGSVRLS